MSAKEALARTCRCERPQYCLLNGLRGALLIDGEREEREFSFDIDTYMSNGKEKIEISCGFNAGFEIYPTDADIADRRHALAVKAKFNPQIITTAQWLKIGELLRISRQNSLEQPDTLAISP